MSDYREKTMAHYGRTVSAYRRFWAPVLHECVQPLVDVLRLGPGLRVLDLGAGVGLAARSFEEKVGSAGRVVGADLTPEMVREFRAGAPGLPVVRLDASRLPFGHDSFDVVYCAFVLQHVREKHRSLAEVSRILKPGGRLGIAAWGRDEPGCRAFDVWEEALDEYGAPPGDPSPPPRWVDSIDSEPGLHSLLEAVGFRPVRVWTHVCDHRWEREHLLGCRLNIGESQRRLLAMTPRKRERFKTVIRERLAGLAAEDLVWKPPVIMATAEKPVPADYRAVCPNCGTPLRDVGCKSRCPKCHFFTDCSDPW